MSATLIAIFIAIFVWWASTGLVMMAVRRAGDDFRILMTAASILAAVSLAGLFMSSRMETVTGTYLGFVSAIGLWAWNEIAFLTGTLTGPRRIPCPESADGMARFRAAFSAVRDHELALLASMIAVIALTVGGANMAGLYLFALLWIMRLSAKLNIFFGAPNSISALMPARLAYLTSYFRTDRMSVVLPISLLASTMLFVGFCAMAINAADVHATVGATLAATFLALAIVEHMFLVLPVEDAALWRWALPVAERLTDSTSKPQVQASARRAGH